MSQKDSSRKKINETANILVKHTEVNNQCRAFTREDLRMHESEQTALLWKKSGTIELHPS